MNLRARHIHAIETFVDNVLGYLINIGTTILVFNMLLGYQISISDNLIAGIFFFIIAWIRKYAIRRFTSNYIQRMYEVRNEA